ncbi:MAG: type IV pilin protein [Candidatus Omnitrophota bacterium]
MNRKGFTLVEIMIVVAIIALLAIIAIPNLLRARLSANEALAKSTLRAMSTAAESYATDNNGQYPTDMEDMTGADPEYLNKDYVGVSSEEGPISGYEYTATMSDSEYTFVAEPATCGTTGNNVYTIEQGGVLTDEECTPE